MGLEAVLLDIKVPERVETDIVNVVWKVILKSDAQVYERFLGGEDLRLTVSHAQFIHMTQE
jgi:hypothetical protein